ncbi:hypothetical protein C2G38_2104394 [Gigaspora rosea]|uniref:Uncharacterized protein n=1 Tax=Gigaspora rosea TaxID=44941 RepID=A0A397ULJ3_9GLOM|nr:hypothetical protein C2G38_2104394 [Gigaspora rosea]
MSDGFGNYYKIHYHYEIYFKKIMVAAIVFVHYHYHVVDSDQKIIDHIMVIVIFFLNTVAKQIYYI